MKLEHGNMWDSYRRCDLFLITTNSSITKAGKLVMGRGISRQARERFPGLDVKLGGLISNGQRYGLLVSPAWPEGKLGLFQVKAAWSDYASFDLIRYSTNMLIDWCAEHPEAKVNLNFPGIGSGRLSRYSVLPIIESLPDQVTVWEYGKEPI